MRTNPHRERTGLAVLLPVRDGARTLPACLESLKAQTFQDFRVIAVDDGSGDETLVILRQAQERWNARRRPSGPSLEIVRLAPGRGIAGALVAAAGAMQGERYIARQDADDLSLPDRFERQLLYLGANPEVGVLATGIETIRDDGGDGVTDGWRRYEAWLSSCQTPEEIRRNLWIECPLPHPTVMMRRDAYERSGGYRDVPWPEDYDLWLRMLRAGVAMGKLPEVLYRWRDHPARASRTLTTYAPERFLACRAHHLSRHLRESPQLRGRAILIWGAGRDGRRAARALIAEGTPIEAFLDIDPRKIGRKAYGRPILSAEVWLGDQLERAAAAPLVLAAVGTAGARELIRDRLESAGFREGSDFLCLA